MNKLTEEERDSLNELDSQLYNLHLDFAEATKPGAMMPNYKALSIKNKCLELLESLLERRLKEQSKKLEEVIGESYRQGARDGEYLTCIEADEKSWESSTKQQIEKLEKKYLDK